MHKQMPNHLYHSDQHNVEMLQIMHVVQIIYYILHLCVLSPLKTLFVMCKCVSHSEIKNRANNLFMSTTL